MECRKLGLVRLALLISLDLKTLVRELGVMEKSVSLGEGRKNSEKKWNDN